MESFLQLTDTQMKRFSVPLNNHVMEERLPLRRDVRPIPIRPTEETVAASTPTANNQKVLSPLLEMLEVVRVPRQKQQAF